MYARILDCNPAAKRFVDVYKTEDEFRERISEYRRIILEWILEDVQKYDPTYE